ncbi:GNAT family N-acetyltransferase [Alphaproteobacteria bacterium GH1-50]|uniref:GNAT family N-acetyltransferase n=1 Tax=Kangsaoukella pontilimi TaxID=2691042 RepID=A0A7C9MFE3_9RHOB|nr:GNAT family N-acetyltransferase [Kangsaoukella pontilimi]
MPDIPVLETERLTLRGHEIGDFEAYAAFWASDRTVAMGGPCDARAAWGHFCKDVAGWTLLGHGAFAMVERETGALVGQISVGKPPHFPELELGWLVMEPAEGQGFATEGAAAVRDWAFDDFGAPTLVSYIARDNAPSIRVAERLGARPDDSAPAAPFANHVVYRHPAPERLQ